MNSSAYGVLIADHVSYIIVMLKAVGGEIGSASALAPKLGPLGLVRFINKNAFSLFNETYFISFYM